MQHIATAENDSWYSPHNVALNTADGDECVLYVRTSYGDKCSDRVIKTCRLRRCCGYPLTMAGSSVRAQSRWQHLHGWLTNCSQSPTATQPHITPTPLKAPPGFLLNLLTENKRSIYSRVLNRPLQYNNNSATSVILATHCIQWLIVIYVLRLIQLEFNTGSDILASLTHQVSPCIQEANRNNIYYIILYFIWYSFLVHRQAGCCLCECVCVIIHKPFCKQTDLSFVMGIFRLYSKRTLIMSVYSA